MKDWRIASQELQNKIIHSIVTYIFWNFFTPVSRICIWGVNISRRNRPEYS